jgi:hypothetical protein
MKRAEAIKKIRETENALDVERISKLRQIEAELELESRQSNFNRARSITVGTAFGGTTEITMRGNGDRFLYSIMQPVEVLELIHQLAANVGCHIAIKPREDFGSWREWRVPDAEKKHLNGHAPFVNDMAVFQRLGAIGFDQAQAEATMEEWLSQKEYEYVNGGAQMKKEQANEKVATKKTVNRRSSK